MNMIMKYLMPTAWKGWTAVIMVVGFVVLAILANGSHKLLKAAAWLGAVVVGGMAIYNELKK